MNVQLIENRLPILRVDDSVFIESRSVSSEFVLNLLLHLEQILHGLSLEHLPNVLHQRCVRAALTSGFEVLNFVENDRVQCIPISNDRIRLVCSIIICTLIGRGIRPISLIRIPRDSPHRLSFQPPKRIDIHQQLLQLPQLQIPQQITRFLQIGLQRLQLLQRRILLLVLHPRAILLLLRRQSEQEHILRQNIDRFLPPLDQPNGTPLPLLLQMKFLFLPGPFVVIFEFFHLGFFGPEAFHFLQVEIALLPSLTHFFDLGKGLFLEVSSPLHRARGIPSSFSAVGIAIRAGRLGLLLFLLPHEDFVQIGIPEGIVLGRVSESGGDAGGASFGAPFFALFEGFVPGGEFGEEFSVGLRGRRGGYGGG
mmetsp:Transcript_21752/g.45260  ORF Transcript_21752/g.45260 Transcript_21752/m.45260 type:complete len:366 (-) Transcript_21752:343-1440(-)